MQMNRRGWFYGLVIALGLLSASAAALRKNNDTKPSSSEEIVHQAALALPPNLSPLSRILNGVAQSGAQSASARIRVENYKAMAGESVRFECPQANPTWFFRRVSNDDTNRLKNGVSSPVEDLIVTRHGIINAAYKYKIMCHSTLKHKVIIINTAEFDDEGLYTCLYTQPLNGDIMLSAADAASANNMVQFRYVFNLTVFTPISGLAMNVKPITMRPSGLEKLVQSKKADQQGFELADGTLTVRENEEIMINCVVDSSRPAADINFNINSGNDLTPNSANSDHLSNGILGLLTTPAVQQAASGLAVVSSTPAPFSSSVISSNTNILRNIDRTFKSIQTTKLRASLDDHGKLITCKAENGFSTQKWESRKVLNVLFAPVCKDPPRTPYYVGINQTLNVECRIHNANPSRVTYEWNLDSINLNTYSAPGSIVGPVEIGVNEIFMGSSSGLLNGHMLGSDFIMSRSASGSGKSSDSDPYSFNYQLNPAAATSTTKPPSAFVNEGFTSRFKWRPTSVDDFGEVRCKATNEIGSTECIYELKLGGVPNPPTDCTHTLKNSSAIISCQVGFHQGDPDIYCYLLRKTDNGAYKEHTRNRESCSFIVNDVNPNKLNEFWIYSSNKHGHNKDQGVYLTIGQDIKPIEPTGNKTFVMLAVIFAVTIFIILLCCFCVKLKKSMSDGDNDSVFEADAYQHKGGKASGSSLSSGQLGKKPGPAAGSNGYSASGKMLRGVKVNSYDKSFEAYETKFVKIDVNNYLSGSNPSLQMKKAMHEKLNGTYVDVKREMAAEKQSRLAVGSTEKLHMDERKQRLAAAAASGHNTLTKQEQVKSAGQYDTSSSDSSAHYQLKNEGSTTNSNVSQESIASHHNEHEQTKAPAGKRASNPADRFNTGAVNPNVVGVGALVRNTITSTQIKKSLSFTKSFINSEDIDDEENDEEAQLNSRECTPLFGNSNGLLMAKDAAKLSENSSSSISVFHNDPPGCGAGCGGGGGGSGGQQKMVTFGANPSVCSPSLLNKSRKMTATPLSTTTSSTLPTKSSASPTTSSSSTAQDELELTANSPSQSTTDTNTNSISSTSSSNHNELHMLTVSDQSFKQLELHKHAYTLPQRPKLSTFSGGGAKKDFTSNSALAKSQRANPAPYRSGKRVVNSEASETTRKCVRISDDLLETKYLNKLCEEIEVSLNVDCECADDYSSNDFSGDYSFDNDLKPSALLKPKLLQSNGGGGGGGGNGHFLFNGEYNDNVYGSSTPKHKPLNGAASNAKPPPTTISNNISHLTDLRKNFEQNIKQLRGAANGAGSAPSGGKPNAQSSPSKKSMGVLV